MNTIDLTSPSAAIAHLLTCDPSEEIILPGAGEPSTIEGDIVRAVTGEDANHWASTKRRWVWTAKDLVDALAPLAGATVQHALVKEATAIRDELLSIHAAGGDIPAAFDTFVRGGDIADGVPANIYQALLRQQNFYLQLNDLVINGGITPEVMDEIYDQANP